MNWIKHIFSSPRVKAISEHKTSGTPNSAPTAFSRQSTASRRSTASQLRARYDAAQTTPDNRKHWAAADGLSPVAANSPQVRLILRNRARYEVANNSYARGIVLTLAHDTIGTGPRLQMLTGSDAVNRLVEQLFADWADAIGLAEKLRTMRMARADSGEAFALLASNPKLRSPVTLDLKLIEAEQVTTPLALASRGGQVDGIVLDGFGNPIEYHILRKHPGDQSIAGDAGLDRLPAEMVLHYFRTDRPGQRRGVPDITPALPLFAQLRRYTLAVIAAAESAANIAILMKTNAPANGEAAEVSPMTEMEFVPNMAVFTPEGWEPSQVKAEQPATTYEMFKREILNEIARCLNMPFNIAACNSSGYNYSSGRLDHQTYYKAIRVEQSNLENAILDRIFAAWMQEAVLVEGLLPQSLRTLDATYPHQWFWDGMEHVDPAKEASAQATKLASHTTTLAYEYARQGRDWESEIRQRAKEVALMNQLGLSASQAAPSTPAESPSPSDTDTPEDEHDADTEEPDAKEPNTAE